MNSFLEDVIKDIKKKKLEISNLTCILPNKRAGLFLKNNLHNHFSGSFFSPEIVSIESFVESLSALNYISNTEALFEFYEAYLKVTPANEVETFDKFYKWGQILLQDFNEIDRYLIPPENIFEYLSAIKKIEHNHWSIEHNQTNYIKNYLAFWNRLPLYYQVLTEQLISKEKGYQGLVYREAINNLEQFIATSKNTYYVFIGFNALNKAEEIIIQELLQSELAYVYWDADDAFINNNFHEAGLFLRKHKEKWPYFSKNEFLWVTKNYAQKKSITITGTPKNIGQIKYVGQLLEEINQKQQLKNTAVVLGDEALLIPLINSLPKNINGINITMGMPLNQTPLASLFEKLFAIHKASDTNYYYKDVITVLSHEFIRPLFNLKDKNSANLIIENIQTNNIVSLSLNQILEINDTKKELIKTLFSSWNNCPDTALQYIKKIILEIKAHFDQNKTINLIPLEYLYGFNTVFIMLENSMALYKHIQSIQTLFSLYKELIKNETLDFQGEPLQGLQIMGMLESRVLDFETVIITSVNEGVLPAGKSQNSFIPFDVKLENGLPTYKEKDAVYTYHFYRLIQRAKHVHLIYNTEPDVLLGGEKSRFITQLEVDNTHNVVSQIVSPKTPIINQVPIQIKKTETVMLRLKDIAENGFSPSSLINYIRNPLDFYSKKVLGIKEFDDVEETVAANTLGTAVHGALEDLYQPLLNQYLTEQLLENLKNNIDDFVYKHIKKEFKSGDITKGKNLIIFEIAKRYVNNFINLEINQIKNGNSIKLLSLEKPYKIQLNIPELNFPVYITGLVDRIDEYNGTTRIIDYKSGKVEPSQLKIKQWENLTADYDKYSKSFQILAYAYMMNCETPFEKPIQAGIVSFKNLSHGFMPFFENNNNLITQETLENYNDQLKQLILEICNPNIPFIEKDVNN